jgi:hypothetical protein
VGELGPRAPFKLTPNIKLSLPFLDSRQSSSDPIRFSAAPPSGILLEDPGTYLIMVNIGSVTHTSNKPVHYELVAFTAGREPTILTEGTLNPIHHTVNTGSFNYIHKSFGSEQILVYVLGQGEVHDASIFILSLN